MTPEMVEWIRSGKGRDKWTDPEAIRSRARGPGPAAGPAVPTGSGPAEFVADPPADLKLKHEESRRRQLAMLAAMRQREGPADD